MGIQVIVLKLEDRRADGRMVGRTRNMTTIGIRKIWLRPKNLFITHHDSADNLWLSRPGFLSRPLLCRQAYNLLHLRLDRRSFCNIAY